MIVRRMLLGIAIAAWPAIANADVISDEEAQCRGKGKGDACEVGGKPGACVDSTCTFNDYSNGPPPKAGQRACFMCQPGAAPPAKQEEAVPAKTDASKSEPGKTETSTPVPAKSGCSIDGALGPVSAALGLGLLVLAHRRRRS